MEDGTAVAAPAPTKAAKKGKAPKKGKAKVKKAKKVAKKSNKATGNVVDPMYRQQYRTHKDHKAPGGGPRVTCNDGVAQFLLDKTDDDISKLAKQVGLSDRWAGWSGLNVGMRRMNFGNVLRGMIRRGEYAIGANGLKKGEGVKKGKAKKAKAGKAA